MSSLNLSPKFKNEVKDDFQDGFRTIYRNPSAIPEISHHRDFQSTILICLNWRPKISLFLDLFLEQETNWIPNNVLKVISASNRPQKREIGRLALRNTKPGCNRPGTDFLVNSFLWKSKHRSSGISRVATE